MKRIILVAFLSVMASVSFGQTIVGLYGGAGLATANNYDVGISGGLNFSKGLGGKTWFGAKLFSQGISLLYDNEANSARSGSGYQGAIMRYKANYMFVAPELMYDLGKKGMVKFFVNAGIGFKISGYDSLHKWNHSFDSATSTVRFDSVVDNSKNMNGTLVRLGTGFVEYLNLGDHWRFTVTEDFGFVTNSLFTTGDASPSSSPYSPQKMSPGYVSLQIGISHYKSRKR